MKNTIAVGVLVFLSVVMASQFTSAEADSNAGILATNSFENSNAIHLIEWFSEESCAPCREFEVDSKQFHTDVSSPSSDVAWIGWFPPAAGTNEDLSRQDAANRMDMIEENSTPTLIVDGVPIDLISEGEVASNWAISLGAVLNTPVDTNLVDFSLVVNLIDSTNDGEADSIEFSGLLTPLVELHNNTAIHVHIIEWSVDPDGLGYRDAIPHVLREWVPRLDFSVEAQNSTSWEYTLEETYLDSANIDLSKGDSDRYGFVVSIHGDERIESESMRVLHIVQGPLPSLDEQGEWGGFPLVLLVNVLLLVGLGMIVVQERIRERGLPHIEGRNVGETEDDVRRIELRITAGNRTTRVTDVSVSQGWRISSIGKKPEIAAGNTIEIDMRIKPKGNFVDSPLLVTIKTDVDELGQWLMDVDMT